MLLDFWLLAALIIASIALAEVKGYTVTILKADNSSNNRENKISDTNLYWSNGTPGIENSVLQNTSSSIITTKPLIRETFGSKKEFTTEISVTNVKFDTSVSSLQTANVFINIAGIYNTSIGMPYIDNTQSISIEINDITHSIGSFISNQSSGQPQYINAYIGSNSAGATWIADTFNLTNGSTYTVTFYFKSYIYDL